MIFCTGDHQQEAAETTEAANRTGEYRFRIPTQTTTTLNRPQRNRRAPMLTGLGKLESWRIPSNISVTTTIPGLSSNTTVRKLMSQRNSSRQNRFHHIVWNF